MMSYIIFHSNHIPSVSSSTNSRFSLEPCLAAWKISNPTFPNRRSDVFTAPLPVLGMFYCGLIDFQNGVLIYEFWAYTLIRIYIRARAYTFSLTSYSAHALFSDSPGVAPHCLVSGGFPRRTLLRRIAGSLCF